MDPKPIPAFYCCYLLRSTVRRASVYVGSTPKPARRLPQHNGHSKGGAAKTAKASLRPWEMTCIVSGFPSSIAALQFEWAWQNTHLTRHNPENAGSTVGQTLKRVSKTNGRSRRPMASLGKKLEHLHLLLRVSYFKRWPLTVRFFSEDVFREVWKPLCKRMPFDAAIPSRIKVTTAFGPVEGSKTLQNAEEVPPLIERLKMLETTYDPVKKHLEKSRSILVEEKEVHCGVCKSTLDLTTDSIVVCSEGGCRSASHMACLAARYLEQTESPKTLVPTEGACPGCRSTLQWATLVKEMTLRMYGGKEVTKLLRKRRGVPQTDDDDDDDMDEANQLTAADVAGEDVDPEDTDDTASVVSNGSDVPEVRAGSTFKIPPRLSMLVEESD